MKINIPIITLLLSWNLLNAQKSAPDISVHMGEQIVARIDTIKITAQEFYNSYEYGPAFVKRKKNSKETYLNYMINEKLLALDGYSRNINRAEEASSMLEEFTYDLAAEELFKQDVLSKVKLSEEEIDTAIIQKSLEVELKWLYSESEEDIFLLHKNLLQGDSFDSLFALQLNDSVFSDERSLKLNRFKLGQMNPELVKIVDAMEAGSYSSPAKVKDGWYILKLINIYRTPVITETEYVRLKQEAANALTKKKMDALSDEYVHALMTENEPVIKRNAFNILRSYMAYYFIAPDKYQEWNESGILNKSFQNTDTININKTILAELKSGSFLLTEFIRWYRNRSLYIHLNDKDLQSFSMALENMVWQMIRDRLLAKRAVSSGLDKLENVEEQSGWWKDKITSSIVKNEIKNSIEVSAQEVNLNEDTAKKFLQEYNARLLRKILSLKKKYTIEINGNVLNEIAVSSENDPQAIDFYTVKRGSLLPRTPYPSIDYEWINWE